MPFQTEQQVYHRLRWDRRFDVGRCAIVYTLRGGGMKRIPFVAWDEAVPWHRIIEFWIGDELAWSRPQRLDRLDELAGASATEIGELLTGRPASGIADAPRALRIAVWNLLFDRYTHEDATPRWRDALDRLAARTPDVIVLVEVTPAMFALIEAHPAFAAYATSHPPASPHLEPYGQVVLSRFPLRASVLPLSRDKRAVLATIEAGGRSLGVAAVHLTSNRKADARAIRADQLAQVLAAIDAMPRDRGWLVAGDFNGQPAELPLGADVWERVHGDAPGHTFDPARNPLAAAHSSSGLGGRYDRVHIRGDVVAIACEHIGSDSPPSDHYGVIADVALDVGRLALALVPPTSVWGPIQRVRCADDPKFAKWPPHVTVELPTAATRAPAIAPFDVDLDRVIALGAVHALAPADPAPLRALGVTTPHLTVSRTRRVPHGLRARWRVDRVELLAEHGGRFVPLGELVAPRDSPAVAHVLARARAAVPGATIVPFGSSVYAPACARDVDVIVTSASDAARLATVFGLRDAGHLRWRGTIDGHAVDVVATTELDGAADARALREHLEHHGRHDAFVAALPRVRAWAHARGLFHNGLGYFGLFGWALLLADPLAHDEALCAVAPEAAFDAWLAHLPRLAHEAFAIAAPASKRDVARHLTPATRATLLAELRAPSQLDLADDPPPGDTLELRFADADVRGAYLARARDLIASLAELAPRVWGRFDGLAHHITVRDRAAALPIVDAFRVQIPGLSRA